MSSYNPPTSNTVWRDTSGRIHKRSCLIYVNAKPVTLTDAQLFAEEKVCGCARGVLDALAKKRAGYGVHDTPCPPARSSYTDDKAGEIAFLLADRRWAVYNALRALMMGIDL